MEDMETICKFWFGSEPDDAAAARSQNHLWWEKDAAVDAEMQRRFEPCVLSAAAHALDDWSTTPQGRLALILLTDQFPRNIYRGTARAFEFDAQARAWSVEGLAQDADKLLRPIERVFFYLPLEHSERLQDQQRSVELFRALASEMSPQLKTTFVGFVDFALKHLEIIERFGRFPHRNAILGRASTAEEIAFLKQPNSSF